MPRKPTKPDRTLTSLSLPTEHLALYRRLAEKAGVPLGDWIAVKLARSESLPEPQYVEVEKEKRLRKQEAAARRREREEAADRAAQLQGRLDQVA